MVAAERTEIEDCRLGLLSADALSLRCREQVARYRHGEGCDDSFTLELFRRAVVERNETAWQALHNIFNEQVLAWCRLATGRTYDADELVAVTWEKFWLNFTPGKLAAACGGPGVLRYLKMCARSAAIDAVRMRGSAFSLDESPIEEPDRSPAPSEANADHDARARFWAIVNGTLRDDCERVLAHLVYECGLKPAEVQARRPDLFPSVADVYRITRNLLDRLKRNRAMRAWAADERC